MAHDLFIEEWGDVVAGTNANVIDVPKHRIAKTRLTVGETSIRTPFDFDERTHFLILYAEKDIQFEIGSETVTASGTSYIIPAGAFRSIGLQSSDKRIAAINKQ